MKKLNFSEMAVINGGHDCPDGTSHEVDLLRSIVFILRINPGTGEVFEVIHPLSTTPIHTCA